ncbi:MAG: glycosyltransferase [Proteobacteria bacterium]|nr:glycosyltransferase [Pseudomonadota bacterium]
MLGTALRRSLAGPVLASAAALARARLRGRSSARDFRRVAVVAALARHNGIASGALLQAAALAAQGIDVTILDATPALRNPLFRIVHEPATAYIVHAAGPQTAQLIGSLLPAAAGAWRVGYWAWELPEPPPDWVGCDATLNEIWTPSGFARDSLATLVRKPLAVVTHPVAVSTTPRTRDASAPFTVLVMADGRSSWARKNPAGAVAAFRAAFGESFEARLILKLHGRPVEMRALEAELRGALQATNVFVVRDRLDEAGMQALYRSADVFLSLHRAEGYGLPMNEAMAQGVPVIATGWSGNLAFMTDDDSILVPYRLVPVRDASGVYRAGTWAEPDIDAAAAALRRLATDPALHARLSAAAHRRAASLVPSFPLGGYFSRAAE